MVFLAITMVGIGDERACTRIMEDVRSVKSCGRSRDVGDFGAIR